MSSIVVKDSEGSFIPATQRPDGSWRKARRVKDGYVPQEEVPLYESKGKQWASRHPQYPVGLDPDIIRKKELELAKKNNTMYSPIPGLIIDPNSESKSKKKKKKKKNASADPANDDAEENKTSSVSSVVLNKQASQKQSAKPTSQTQQPHQQKREKSVEPDTIASTNTPIVADPTKRIKNLRKKLREIEALEQRITNGESKLLDKDQLDKVSRKEEVLSEILALELSLENN